MAGFLNDRAESEYNNADIAGPVGDFISTLRAIILLGPECIRAAAILGGWSWHCDLLGLSITELERDPLQQPS